MDAGEGSPQEISTAYRLLDRVNQRLGGYRLTEGALVPLLADRGRPLEIVDVAGGSGEFARRILTWTRSAGLDARATVVDRSPVALAAALDPGAARQPLAAVRGDALDLPFSDRSVDVVHCSCFFHHLSTAGARDALAEMCRVSRRVVVVNDLVRSRVAAASIWLLTRALVENRLVRADGPLSVLKSFVPDELLAIGHAVGLSDQRDFRWTLQRGFPYRMALVGVRAPRARPLS
jgi:ubiquinone/menaquinone biosynthesis C-methylase UbiE